MTYELWWLDGGRRVPRRDPGEDDPDWYRDHRGKWVKRTQWSADVYPDGWDEYTVYVQETTSAERQAILRERKRREGLVDWRGCWVPAGTAQELEQKFQEGLARDRRELAEARRRSHQYRIFWC